MLDPFQSNVLQGLAANRSADSFVADGAALNRDGSRQSRDIDIFHKTVGLIDDAVARDLAALDLLGAHPWLLALAVMGKDAELSPEAVLERARRLLREAGDDDEDPDYAGPSLSWTAVRARMSHRLGEDLTILRGFRWFEWAGALPLDGLTARMALGITPDDLAVCVKGRASPTGTWPTILATSSEMLRRARHPDLAGIALDLSAYEAAWLADAAHPP